MNKKIRIIAITVFISAFLISAINIPLIINKESEGKKSIQELKSTNDIVEKQPPNDDEQLKSAGPEPSQQYNFSFNTQINEKWNSTYYFKNYTNFEITRTFMSIENSNGYKSTFHVYIYDLINDTTDETINLSDLPSVNRSLVYVDSTESGNLKYIPNNGHINGTDSFSYDYGILFFFFAGAQSTYRIRYNATIFLNDTRSRIIKTYFLPDTENTKSDFINWELNYSSYIYGNYSAILNIENFTDFSLNSVSGRDGKYWSPIYYKIIPNGIELNESHEEYLIKMTTLNQISIIYNENLTLPYRPYYYYPYQPPDDNELRLYVTCKMAGNLTIIFKNSTNGVNRLSQIVVKNEIFYFNYILYNTTPGGVGSLEIILISESDKINFGMKLAEITFHKNAVIGGLTQNTTAFTDFFIVAGYMDNDYLVWLQYLNITGQISLNEWQMLNLSMITHATVTYQLEDLFGELNYSLIPSLGIKLYNDIVDLKTFLIKPNLYNITLAGSKLGYTSVEVNTPFLISKKNVALYLTITPESEVFTIEENFAITAQFVVGTINPPYYETFLRVPVNISFAIYKNDVIDDQFTFSDIVQTVTLQGPMQNNSIPGKYIINISIVSDYYNGSITFEVEVVKKPLLITLDYDEDDLVEDEEFEVNWALESGRFAGNPENMTLEIYLDGVLDSRINLGSGSSGITKFELDEGDYTLTYRIISPFYTAETSVKIEVEMEEEPELSWLEENWIWLVIGVILLAAFAIFATFMVISRHKLKIKRGLESELITLKNRITSTETAINTIETQIAQIASIFWILVVHSEQGTTMVEIDKFYFEKILNENQQDLIGKGEFKDSALIGGFLTAIRNFSRETSGTSMASQPIFNSETDYSTVVDNMEIHRRILEGTNYFMAFVSTKPTSVISYVLAGINTLFEVNYGEAAKKFVGRVAEFMRFRDEVPKYLHEEIRKLQKELNDQQMLLEHYGKHLNQVQDKIGIKPKKIN